MVDPTFGTYLLGKFASMAGIWAHTVVAGLVAWELTGSTFMVGLISAAQFGPQILFGPLSGALADRGDPRRQLIVGRLVCITGSVWLALQLGVVGMERTGMAPVVLASVVVGVGFTIGGPAMGALLPDLVRPAELPTAVTLDNLPITLGRAIGPAFGGVVAAQGNYAAGFAIGAVGHGLFVVVLLAVRARPSAPRAPGADVTVRAAIVFLRRHRSVVAAIAGVGMAGIAGDPAITLAPRLVERWEMGVGAVGACTSVFGIGALIGLIGVSVVTRLLGRAWVGTSGLAVTAAGLVGVAAAGWGPAGLAAFGMTGIGMSMSLTGCTQWIYNTVPGPMRGRVLGFWFLAFSGSRPVAALANGALAESVGVVATLIVTAALSALVALWCLRAHVLAPPTLSAGGSGPVAG